MGHLYDLSEPFTPRIFCHAVPGPVRNLRARVFPGESLVLQWRPPAGGSATSYRVERTREGRAYETLVETCGESCFIRDVPLHEPWFYKVTAMNARGAGRAKLVWLFQRAGNGRSRLLPVAVIPGLRVNICEFVRM